MTTKEWLIDWFSRHSAMSAEVLEEKSKVNYMEEGFIDSFSFVQMLSDIDDEYDILFENEDFVNPLFTNIDGLAQMIDQRKR
ncbi:MAG: hypothetical protein J6N56_08605 [Bacteroidales bacterium]|nr:hypothetical protein [Bacteroidales bacterium]MBR2136143.1 hypothetical protein [Bacteroidales bacterium]